MSRTLQEDLADDIFNYTDPAYLNRIAGTSSESFFVPQKGIQYWHQADKPGHLLIRYEMAPVHSLIKSADFQSSVMVALAKFLTAFKTKADDGLVASSSDLAEVLRPINDLAFEDEADQFGPIRPTYDALKLCMKLVLELAEGGRLFKPSDVTTDHNGDIRISWVRGNRETEIVCPSEGQPYIYYSSQETYGTETDLTSDKIAERVRWAIDGK